MSFREFRGSQEQNIKQIRRISEKPGNPGRIFEKVARETFSAGVSQKLFKNVFEKFSKEHPKPFRKKFSRINFPAGICEKVPRPGLWPSGAEPLSSGKPVRRMSTIQAAQRENSAIFQVGEKNAV